MEPLRWCFLGSVNSLLSNRVQSWLTSLDEGADWLLWDALPPANQRFDFGFSAGYKRILKPEHLAQFRRGVMNLHPGYLPYNRGRFPNVWPLIDKSPAGVTIHWMDEGVDTGPILVQRQTTVHPWDTAYTLYERLLDDAIGLLSLHWNELKMGVVDPTPQNGQGTEHKAVELERLRIDAPGQIWNARSLVDILRARTFPGHQGCVLDLDGEQVEVTVNLRRVNADRQPPD